jgi:glycosyltransferase involved in cell wall biosynthesis
VKILLLHQNFPGQFLHLAPALAARGHEVVALTAEENKRPSPVPVYRYRTPPLSDIKGLGATYAAAAERGSVAARAAAQLQRDKGFRPDVVFGHAGWGETLFLREIFPKARHLTYAEFMYRATGADTGFDPEFQTTGPGVGIAVTARAAHLVQAAHLSDACLSPTEWQASTFPEGLRQRITVIHDGIDTVRVRPDPEASLTLPGGQVLRAGDEVLSFVSRRLEPYRGYHIFMRALPDILTARPDAQVVIVGDEGQSYGTKPPDARSWKQRFLEEVQDRIDPARVHFLGRVPYDGFVSLMQLTRVHAYLTYPFVLSWSMLEAMAAGALVVGSRTPPVQEVIQDGVNGRLVDFFDVAGWSAALAAALADPRADDALRLAARETVIARYDLKTVCLPRLIAFVEGT